MTMTIYDCLDQFSFSIHRVTVQAVDVLDLPGFKGSTIHGAFGHALQKILCPFQYRECRRDCVLLRKSHCFYQYLYETRVPDTAPYVQDDTIRNKDGKQPSPFVIGTLPEQKTQYLPGESFSFDLVLFGDAQKYFSYVVYALDTMCKTGIGKKKGKCLLHTIQAVKPDGSERQVYHHHDQLLQSQMFPITLNALLAYRPCPDAGEPVTFEFKTRLELKAKGKMAPVDFDNLFRRLLARVTTIAKLHCGIDCSGIDFKKACHGADEIETISSSLVYEYAKRYSSRQKTRTPFGGKIGKIIYSGNLAPFWPVLVLGEKIHVGKKTSFGFGQYEMKYQPPFS